MKYSALLLGLATYIPGFNNWRYRTRSGGSTYSAEYCYSVWLRHLTLATENGLSTIPKVVAEIGPGDSIGVGLAAMISGADRYYALDVINYSDIQKNLAIFDELVKLFKRRANIPNQAQFPEIKPTLSDYSFPHDILTEDVMVEALSDTRIAKIRNSISNRSMETLITYQAPWYAPNIIKNTAVDMIFSQAVLEHVDDLENTYRAMLLWLKNDGIISHQVDFKSHGTAQEWNGHWKYSDFIWRLIKGGRPYLLNRKPCSFHINLIRKIGFHIIFEQRVTQTSTLEKSDLAHRFRFMSDEDLTVSGLFFQAIKSNSSQEK